MVAIISKLWPFAVAILFGSLIAWWITDMHFTEKVAGINQEHAEQLRDISITAQQATEASNQRIKEAQQSLSDLDKKSTEALTHAQSENKTLRDAVASGTRSVRIATAKLAACGSESGSVPGSGSVGDGTGVELSRDTGSDILDLRSGIISDREKINYLQGYIRQLQNAGAVAK